MSNEALLFVILFACGAYWYFGHARAKKPPSASTETQTSSHIPEPVLSSVQPATDPFLDAVASEKARSDAVVAAATLQYKRDLDERFSEDLALKERLSRVARTNELDKALVALWQEIERYPSWSNGQGFAKINKLHLTGVSGETVKDVRSIEFTYRNHVFKLSERRTGIMQSPSYADFSLLEDSIEVFAISCSSDYQDYGTNYRCLTITAFKKQGDWASVLLELYAQIQIESNKISAGFGYIRADEIKSRFKE